MGTQKAPILPPPRGRPTPSAPTKPRPRGPGGCGTGVSPPLPCCPLPSWATSHTLGLAQRRPCGQRLEPAGPRQSRAALGAPCGGSAPMGAPLHPAPPSQVERAQWACGTGGSGRERPREEVGGRRREATCAPLGLFSPFSKGGSSSAHRAVSSQASACLPATQPCSTAWPGRASLRAGSGPCGLVPSIYLWAIIRDRRGHPR